MNGDCGGGLTATVLQDLRLVRYIDGIQLKVICNDKGKDPLRYIMVTDKDETKHPYAVIPIPVHLRWTPRQMREIYNCIVNNGDVPELESLVLAIVAADSSIVYYRLRLSFDSYPASEGLLEREIRAVNVEME
ncbi:hypothetical protein BASA50_000564 [Batrachochytrium salamandrivorans]|uniref:tRNA-splicing endonuclease subunit Sen15 domain-containing protein n=1 Tax=Batrachochytrium salamandrivorans TaxID=1357716 RepID=A0ABQ8ETL8_9FUNG|nr:hypothetical protein BASA62_009892 [Batrachochytrium salamandrivorans]KAH6572481.1 hypothetical protein BASA60_006608 [Batrachochytrium salamandrivorans]KAH6586391.1 hypothetical protein BASA50_000564 [Batrachochytrium salamandrivorans]KAH6602026.1 hypothetical protein BASA61_001529 [Batrachochytrium salamandrivorans]KAH9268067.1 hypothetical protein BASA83_009573 [Batrachochytrium salamandrivorans]